MPEGTQLKHGYFLIACEVVISGHLFVGECRFTLVREL